MKPTSAPSAVAVSSSPDPTTAAEVIMPGPRKRSFPRSLRGGSLICEPSITYGSTSAPRVVTRGDPAAGFGGGADVDIDVSPLGLDEWFGIARPACRAAPIAPEPITQVDRCASVLCRPT